jgi:hypothetical protein
MDTDQALAAALAFARAAGLKLPDGRLAQLAFGLAAVNSATTAISRHDYGAAEPASRFVPPPSR